MPRNHTRTPQNPTPLTSTEADGRRVVTRVVHGVTHRFSDQPSGYVNQELAQELAEAFLVVGGEVSGSAQPLQTAVRDFLAFMDDQPRSADRGLALSDVRRQHLDAWEVAMLQRQREERTDTAYRYVVHLFALLRRIEDDNPGTLHPDVNRRLESSTRLPHIRRPGDTELAPREVRALRAAAHRQVYRALRRDTRTATPDVLIALHILWSLSTGEPPEVIRAVMLDDVIASTTPQHDQATADMSHAQRLTYLASLDAVTTYAVTFHKRRSGQTYQRVFTPHQRAVFRAITNTIVLGAPVREELQTNALWVVRTRNGPRRADWRELPLGRWITRHLPDRDISLPHVYRRLRKTVTTREALADPVRYLRDGRRHTARTFFDHYTNSTVLRAHAGRVLMDSINEVFDAAVGGPTVILPEAENLISRGTPVQMLTPEEVEALKRGELETPMAACRDPLDSPHGQEGHLCPVATTGDCFACPNALILRRHLPAALRLAELTHPDRAAKIEVWAQRWRMVHDTLTQAVLPAFSDDDIADATAHTDEVLLDPTLINDLGEA